MKPHIANFAPLIVDLAAVDDGDLRQAPLDAAAAITLGALRDATRSELVFEQWHRWADSDDLDDNDLRAILTYSTETSDLAPRELRRHFARTIRTRSHAMTSTADQLRNQGRLAAFREMLATQATDRFGYVEPDLQARINRADEHQLRAAIRHILTAETQDQILG